MAIGAEMKLETRDRFYPLTPMQQGMLLHSLRAKESGVDVTQLIINCREVVDIASMECAWQKLAARHAILRTSFKWENVDEPRQEVHPQAKIPFAQKDWRERPASEQTVLFEELLDQERKQGFRLNLAPLMRVVLVRNREAEFTMLWTYQHILLDARSLGLLVKELFDLYEADQEGLTPPRAEPLPFSSYIEWLQQQDWSQGEKFWREKLGGFRGATPLIESADPAHGIVEETKGPILLGGVKEKEMRISEEVTSTLRSVAREHGLTLNTFVQGAWAVLLSRYSNEQDVVFGAVRACRHSTIAGVEGMVGLLINTLPVRIQVRPEMKVLPWLKQIRQQWVELREFEHTPLAQIQAWSELLSGSPLFQTILNVQDPAWDAELRAQGGKWEQRRFSIRNQPGFPLALDVYAGADLIVKAVYRPGRFDESTIVRLLDHFRNILEWIAKNLDAHLASVQLLGKSELHQLLIEWNQTEADYPKCCVHELFEAQARRTPGALALSGEHQLSFGELEERANQLARQLQAMGVRPEMPVGICMERSVEMVIGQLAILKAGGAYVPIDPAYPPERIKFLLDDAGVTILLTQRKLLARIPKADGVVCLDNILSNPIDPQRATPPKNRTNPQSLAYIIYTSGSTGQPKGVEIEHRGLVNLVTWHQRTYEVIATDRASLLASPAFDASVWELWPYLTIGASVHIPRPQLRFSPKDLLQWLFAERITLSFLPTPLAEAVMDEPWPKEIVLRALLTGGDRLRRWPKQGLPFKLVNHYGPTENTVVTTAGVVSPSGAVRASKRVPSIGRPIANVQVYILDERMQPVPIGVPGELHIGGDGLARGYLNRPELTKERFISSPFKANPKARLYKTGDRGRFLSDGSIEYLERIDQQVKIRGYRIEPGEVESFLAQHPAIRQAAVTAREDFDGERRLVAYFSSGEKASDAAIVEKLRKFLGQKLPDYMVPTAFVRMGALPLTPNGKVDRKALPAPSFERDLKEGFVAPRTPTEELLASIWSELLHLARVGAKENFFRLGGHSLLATQVISRIRSAFGVELGVEAVFEFPVLAALAERIDLVRKETGNGEEVRTRREGEAATATPQISPRPLPSGGSLPNGQVEVALSFAQERLWFLEQLQPGQSFNNIAVSLRLTGELNVQALQSSLKEVVRRHRVFRTAFRKEKGRPKAILSGSAEVPVPILDLTDHPAEQRETEAQRIAEAEARAPFDLSQGHLLRAKLLRLDSRDHLLLLTTHHIVSDGWSMKILYHELGALYEAFAQGYRSPLPDLPIHYSDFAQWQRERLQGLMLEEQLAYWREQLKGPLPALGLPSDRPRPPIQTFRGATQFFRLPSSLYAALRNLSRREDVTMFMLLLSAFQTLLHRYSGQEEIIVGSAVAGRTVCESEHLTGLFLNTLALRTDLSGQPTFLQLLKRVRKVALEAYGRQDVPFEKVVEALPLERDLSRSPLFQVMFVLQDAPFEPTEKAGLKLAPTLVGNGASKFDLTLFLEEYPDGLGGSVEYNTDLFEPSTILRFLGHLQTLLEGIVANPKQPLASLPILTEAERQQLIVEWNSAAAAYEQEKCIHHLFEEQVQRTPEQVVAVFEEDQLTYRELNEQANQLGHYLQRLGVGPEVRVGICLPRSLRMLIGLLGILKAGGCYVPLDPAYPKERLAFMLEDSGASVLLTEADLAQGLATRDIKVVCLNAVSSENFRLEPVTNPNSAAQPENLAYVIYTSGSTGKPKGVMISHRNVSNFFTGMDERVGRDPGVWLAVTSISFDISVLELFWTITRGFKVVIQGEDGGFRPVVSSNRRGEHKLDFSLFYFASEAGGPATDKYRLLTEGAKFADQHGFVAVWTPERHFHSFGGLFPNPAVTSAALAMITEKVQLRAGSLVLPLHDPCRVAEEWAVVDQLSKGRTGVSFACGWHPRDFAIAPQNYAHRKEIMLERIEIVRQLWRGESIRVPVGNGEEAEIRVFPRPVQPELPIWITSSGTAETFQLAGEMGLNLLTHLTGQSLEQLAKKIEIYRAAWRKKGHRREGSVTLMLHTFVWDKTDFPWEKVRGSLSDYLKAYRHLTANGHTACAQPNQPGLVASSPSKTLEIQIESLLHEAVDRYTDTSGLFGTPEACLQLVDKLKIIGVDEAACLVDFGVETELVLKSLQHLNELKERSETKTKPRRKSYTLPEQMMRHGVTHLQCTPSLAAMLAQDPQGLTAMRSLRKLLLGGEALPAALVKQLEIPGELLNMYGPTETTVWSTTHVVTRTESLIPIGKPIANTEIYIVDRLLQPVPAGVPGELLIGGAGVVRGYLNRAELTTERFIHNPFKPAAGARLYRTGDLARFLPDGTIEFLGRLDHQVKLRGFRIELGEIEAALCQHPQVREAVVVLREFSPGDKRLVAYLSLVENQASDPSADNSKLLTALRSHLKAKLPDYMVPSGFEILARLPLTPNGKVDRKALPEPASIGGSGKEPDQTPLQNDTQKKIAAIWQKLLRTERVGPDDSFFDLGGHSLLVVQLHAELCEAFQTELPIIRLFQHPTVSSLARFFNEEGRDSLSFQKIRDRARLLRGAWGGLRKPKEATT